MDGKSILIIDLGTSKVHANIIRIEDGKLLHNVTESYLWVRTDKDRTEILSETIWEAAQAACEKVLAGMSGETELAGITFSWFGAELVTLDENGNEVFPLIVSFDSRAGKEAEELRKKVDPKQEKLIGRGGLTSQSNPAKMLWLRRNDPERFSRIRYIGTIEQYFYLRLGMPLRAERSMLQTLQYHSAEGTILEDVLEASETPGSFLDYPVVEGDGILGELETFGRVKLPGRIPVLYGGHDCILSQLGSGVSPSGNGILGDVSGTYDLMGFFRTREQIGPVQADCANTPVTDVYSYMYGVPAGAILSDRVAGIWGECSGELLTELFEKARFDGMHGGLWELPDWERIRSDRTVLNRYEKMQVFESLVEEITFELRECYEQVCAKNGGAFRAVRIGGGASRSKSWLRLKADLFQVPVELPDNIEVSSMGAAVIAAKVLGYYPDYETALSHMVTVSERYEPQGKERYERLYRSWKDQTGRAA